MNHNYIIGFTQTPAGEIPLVKTMLKYSDYIGTAKVRWAINRNNYKVAPGLYGVGSPTEASDVFVTANYKLSFDHLRKNLTGFNAWILVLNTKGINVWCAAGKGTFGTKELIHQIQFTQLQKIINHRRIIVPQLGATGISAHQVKTETESASSNFLQTPVNITPSSILKKDNFQLKCNTGFKVIYGPVRASDIKTFVNGGYKATKEMRTITFKLLDRIKLIPVDFVYGKIYLLVGLALVLVLSGVSRLGFSFNKAFIEGTIAMLNVFLAYIAGIVITPVLLPYIPARPFALKGFITGFILAFVLLVLDKLGKTYIEHISWFLIITALSSFVAMNFTGSSTYTSLSGVKKEMKVAIPLQIAFAALGIILFTIGKFI